MTTCVDAHLLLQATKIGSAARHKKTCPPVLNSILVRRVNAHVEIISTDLEKVAKGTCAALSRDTLGEEVWGIVLPGNKSWLPFLDWLRALSPQKSRRENGQEIFEAVTLEIMPRIQTLKAKCGNITATFKGIDEREYPVIPEEKLNDAQFAVSDKKSKRGGKRTPETVLARHAEEAWQKALKQTKRMSAKVEIEHWKTWQPVLEEHRAQIEKHLIYLAEVVEKQKQSEIEWQAECRQREEEEHTERLARLAWLDSVREGLRAEFDATLRGDKRDKMNSPVEAWSFRAFDDSAAPTYPTSYHWLEAVFVWNGKIYAGRQYPKKYGRRRGKGKVDVIVGYEVNRYQIGYTKLLTEKWYEAHPGETISLEEINNPYGEEPITNKDGRE